MSAVVVVLLLTGAAASTALAQEQAREHYLRGKELYSKGHFADAVVAFTAANKLKPSPVLDYNMGRCHDRLGASALAIVHYERYLAGRPNAKNRAEVTARITSLKTPPPAPAPVAPARRPPPVSKVTPPAPTPRTRVAEPRKAEEPGMPAIAPTKPDPSPRAAGEPEHEAMQAASGYTRARQRPPKGARPRTGQPGPRGPRESVPIYKKWWFWLGCAGGAVILGFIIATAASKNDSGSSSSSKALVGPPRSSGLSISF